MTNPQDDRPSANAIKNVKIEPLRIEHPAETNSAGTSTLQNNDDNNNNNNNNNNSERTSNTLVNFINPNGQHQNYQATDSHNQKQLIRFQHSQQQQQHQQVEIDGETAESSCCCRAGRRRHGDNGLCFPIGSGLINDFKRRLSFYKSDYADGILGHHSFYKTCSTTIFLYFSVLLPCIAFGVVDTNNTNGQIDPKKTMIGQAIGGAIFAIFSGQPLIVIMTTAPLCIYVKVIYEISIDLDVEFSVYYSCVAIWMSFFLIIMSFTNLSNLMKYCTRSTEDIFAIFTAFAFGSDGVKEAFRSFNRYYWNPECVTDGNQGAHSVYVQPQFQLHSANHATTLQDNYHLPMLNSTVNNMKNNTDSIVIGGNTNNNTLIATSQLYNNLLNGSATILASTFNDSTLPIINSNPTHDSAANNPETAPTTGEHMTFPSRCQRETCILFLFLMFGTLWLANSFSSFDRTPYLSYRKREFIKDYALAISVLLFSFVGSYVFMDIPLDVFEFSEFHGVNLVNFDLFTVKTMLSSSILGLMLSILFYIDQNICGAMVNNAPFKLKKGDYFHLDLLVLAILNLLLSIFGLPFMHGKLPHSHLHSKALAQYEERITEGHVESKIVSIRETRLTQLFCSIGIGFSLFAVPYPIAYIPLPVLSGVFLYTALAEFKSNSMVERICLIFSEVGAYPSSHYTRRVSRHKIHIFTAAQVLQLAIVSFIGFYPNPYVNMTFPVAIALFIPFRSLVLPLAIENKYLEILDECS